ECRRRRPRRRLHGGPVARYQRAVHDRDGQPDAVRWARLGGKTMIRKSFLCSLSTLAAIASQGVAAQADDALFNASKPLEIVDQGTFSIPRPSLKDSEHHHLVRQ